MRYDLAENLIILAMEMQAAQGGLSLADIRKRFGVSHRTAQRMKDTVLRLFIDADEVSTDERQKRWRIPKGTLDRLLGVTADELADVEIATQLLRREGMHSQATSLDGLAAKLRASLKPHVQSRIEPDLEALMEAEQLAVRPGPRPRIRLTVLETLRKAIIGCREVEIHHKNRVTRRMAKRIVQPYGFLYGHRHYLVAFDPSVKFRKFRLFSLPNIQRVQQLEAFFERDEGFSLELFTRNSFAIFQEEPFDTVWRFSPAAAHDAADFQFHPDQKTERKRDGSLIVSFRAGGELEMCWHLFCWGKDVEVLEPQSLRQMIQKHRVKWPGLP